MTVKIQLSGHLNVKPGTITKFHHINNPLETVELKFIGNSRIDGFPIFDVTSFFKYPLMEYQPSLNSAISVLSIDLLTKLEDHTSLINYNITINEVSKFLIKMHGITDNDLSQKTSKQIIRELKLDNLLN